MTRKSPSGRVAKTLGVPERWWNARLTGRKKAMSASRPRIAFTEEEHRVFFQRQETLCWSEEAACNGASTVPADRDYDRETTITRALVARPLDRVWSRPGRNKVPKLRCKNHHCEVIVCRSRSGRGHQSRGRKAAPRFRLVLYECLDVRRASNLGTGSRDWCAESEGLSVGEYVSTCQVHRAFQLPACSRFYSR